MSNLGAYQKTVVWMKRCGGPHVAIPSFIATSYGVLRSIEAIITSAIKHLKKEKPSTLSEKFITVTSSGKDSSNLSFSVGDSYKILFSDDEVALIEKVGDKGNPYVVSPDFLRSISDYS